MRLKPSRSMIELRRRANYYESLMDTALAKGQSHRADRCRKVWLALYRITY